MSKRATTQDIADLAGVSQSTVSMILSGSNKASFSAETVKKVADAAARLNYTPRKRSAHKSSADVIAVFAPTPGNPYYSTLVQSLENEAHSNGFGVLVCNTYYDKSTELAYVDLISSIPFTGVIFTYQPMNQERMRQLSLATPVVVISDTPDCSGMNAVSLNSFAAGSQIAEHLLSLGHRRIALITTQLENNILRMRRLEGMVQTVEETGAELLIQETDVNVHYEQYKMNLEYSVGYELTRKICSDSSITAYVGINDMVAYGVMDALLDSGCRIPEDKSVCGFDNIFPSRFHNISLTTVDSFLTNKGHDAFEMFKNLLTRGRANTMYAIHQIEYKPKLIVRKSSGPAKK